MSTVAKNPSAAEYQQMYDNMQILPGHESEISEAVSLIFQGKERYKSMCKSVNPLVPWYAIGLAHYMECSCNFNQHIHDGDPLTARTVNEPSGRPVSGQPPFTWEESCADWMGMKGWNKWQDWHVTDILARLEMNNGFGYRNRGIPTPYLWSYTQWYTSGKYVSDGSFDPNAVSKQAGSAVLLKKILSSSV